MPREIQPMKIWSLPSNKESEFASICESGKYFAQEKIDGALYIFEKDEDGECYLFSRTVSKKDGHLVNKIGNVPHIQEAFAAIPNDTILVGEIYIPGGTSKSVNSIMLCLSDRAVARQKDQGFIHYYIHDMLYCDGANLMPLGAEERYNLLQAFWTKYVPQKKFLHLAESFDTNIPERLAAILATGGEGIVMKKKDVPYSPGLRPAWSCIKRKQMDTTDLVCTRTIPATKEYTGKEVETWSYWIIEHNGLFHKKCEVGKPECIRSPEFKTIPVSKPYYFGWHTAIGIGAYDPNGNLVELGTVSSGFTDEERAAMGADPASFVGKTVALRCMSIDRKEKTLRHPVFVQWRDDKPGADCLIKEIFG